MTLPATTLSQELAEAGPYRRIIPCLDVTAGRVVKGVEFVDLRDAGDPVELGALGAVLGEGRATGQRAFVGSVKTNIGHTEGAAGVAGLVKVALALDRGAIPPSLHCKCAGCAIN